MALNAGELAVSYWLRLGKRSPSFHPRLAQPPFSQPEVRSHHRKWHHILRHGANKAYSDGLRRRLYYKRRVLYRSALLRGPGNALNEGDWSTGLDLK